MTTQCLSVFLRTQCQRPDCHCGLHFAADGSGHSTVWTDLSADDAEVVA